MTFSKARLFNMAKNAPPWGKRRTILIEKN
jgi:hypothetical protein